VVLPSGKVSLSARGDVVLTDDALIDVAGRAIAFNDVTQYGWGGDVLLDSRSGNIRQAAGSTIDLSAQHNQAGKLRAVATDAAAGIVDLQGKILGGTSGYYAASGTSVPYRAALWNSRPSTWVAAAPISSSPTSTSASTRARSSVPAASSSSRAT
jgi:hypothetical protein